VDATGGGLLSPAPKMPMVQHQPKIVSADSSLASTLYDEAAGKGDERQSGDDASIVSEISWTGSVTPEEAGRARKCVGTIVGPRTSNSITQKTPKSMPLKKRILREQATTPLQVNLDEATVVVALFELANPVKLIPRTTASAARYSSEVVQIMEV